MILWSHEETDRLLELIEYYGRSWSLIGRKLNRSPASLRNKVSRIQKVPHATRRRRQSLPPRINHTTDFTESHKTKCTSGLFYANHLTQRITEEFIEFHVNNQVPLAPLSMLPLSDDIDRLIVTE